MMLCTFQFANLWATSYFSLGEIENIGERQACLQEKITIYI